MMTAQQQYLANHQIHLDRVALKYGRGTEVLRDINLALEKGSLTFLTGPSGAGKTTLLRLLSLDIQPTRGLISLFGHGTENLKRADRYKFRRRIGFVSQNFDLIPHLNVFDNAALPLRVAGQSLTEYQDDVIDLLRWVGLGERMTHMPETLSSGETQRVAIARAVVTQPDLLLADEPTGNVDPEMSERLLKLFMEMNRGGTTVLIATHDTGLLNQIKADTLYLKDGEITQGRPS